VTQSIQSEYNYVNLLRLYTHGIEMAKSPAEIPANENADNVDE